MNEDPPKWSVGRGPGGGELAIAWSLVEAVEGISALPSSCGIGGAQGWGLFVWRYRTSPRGYIVGPLERVGRGGILAATLEDALELRRQADAERCWPESNMLVVWREGTRRAFMKHEAEAILELERQAKRTPEIGGL